MPFRDVESMDNRDLSINTIDSDVRAVREALAAVSTLFANHVVTILKDRNDLTRVQSLPTELFTRIIDHSLDSHELKDRYRLLIKYSGVSHKWKRVIAETPAFWSHLQWTDSAEILQLAVGRSKNHGLTIRSNAKYEYYDGEKSQRLIKMAGPHALRWRTVEWRTSLNMHPYMSFVETPPRHLRRVSLTLSGTPGYEWAQKLLAGSTELIHVDLTYVPLPWDAGILAGLRYLALRDTNTQIAPLPSATQLLAILQACPMLEELALVKMERKKGDPRPDALPEDHPAVALSRLRVLEIEAIPLDLLSAILCDTETPQCRDMSVTYYWGNDVPKLMDLLKASSGKFVAIVDDAIRTETPLRLSINNAILSYDSEIDGVHVSLTVSDYKDPRLVYEWMVATFPDLSAGKVEVNVQSVYGDDIKWPPTVFGIGAAVTSIHLQLSWKAKPNGGRSLYEYLSTPVVESGIAKWQMPRLQAISLPGVKRGDESIRSLLKSRRGGDLSPGEGVVVELPVDLSVNGQTYEDFTVVKEEAKPMDAISSAVDVGAENGDVKDGDENSGDDDGDRDKSDEV